MASPFVRTLASPTDAVGDEARRPSAIASREETFPDGAGCNSASPERGCRPVDLQRIRPGQQAPLKRVAVGLGLDAHRKRRGLEHGPRGTLTPDRPVDGVAPQKCPPPQAAVGPHGRWDSLPDSAPRTDAPARGPGPSSPHLHPPTVPSSLSPPRCEAFPVNFNRKLNTEVVPFLWTAKPDSISGSKPVV